MGWNQGGRIAGLCAAAALSVAACATTSSAPSAEPASAQVSGQAVNPDAKAMAAFQERVKQYLALHQKLEATLEPLPKAATSEQIHTHQLGLAALIREARRTARPGDLFDAGMQRIIRRLMARVFSGPEGVELKAIVMDENPGRIRIGVNARYPDALPLSTVPPQVLKGLPNVPSELEYRFIGRALILFDTHAHLIVDIMENAIP